MVALARKHFRIYGRVQGLGFRYLTQREANRLNLAGWVRNNPDGSVEAVVEGEQAMVETMTEWLHSGPAGARVDEISIRDEKPAGDFTGFNIVR